MKRDRQEQLRSNPESRQIEHFLLFIARATPEAATATVRGLMGHLYGIVSEPRVTN